MQGGNWAVRALISCEVTDVRSGARKRSRLYIVDQVRTMGMCLR